MRTRKPWSRQVLSVENPALGDDGGVNVGGGVERELRRGGSEARDEVLREVALEEAVEDDDEPEASAQGVVPDRNEGERAEQEAVSARAAAALRRARAIHHRRMTENDEEEGENRSLSLSFSRPLFPKLLGFGFCAHFVSVRLETAAFDGWTVGCWSSRKRRLYVRQWGVATSAASDECEGHRGGNGQLTSRPFHWNHRPEKSRAVP